MRTCEITVYGLVQGVGYRPFVAEQAEEMHMEGQVRNAGGIVIIDVRGDAGAVDELLRRIWHESPAGARIDHVDVNDLGEDDFAARVQNTVDGAFRIVESTSHDEDLRLLPPDLPTCENCERELLDPANRRYRYPFISCVACGPRFSIMKAVPYDRKTITMDRFPMCPACRKEYESHGNIRRDAQTISCWDCGPVLELRGSTRNTRNEQMVRGSVCANRNESEHWQAGLRQTVEKLGRITGEQALQIGIGLIKEGKIAAIKDIGGFHFAFLPTISEPAKRLREFKHRETKPFAVMFPDLDSIREYCELRPKEEELLRSQARPIVLLRKKIGPDRRPVRDFVPEICGDSDRIGVMLPCDPLQILILKETGPLVMTSGNRGGEPIAIRDEEIQEFIDEGCPDFMLTHDREILTPLEDSIFQYVQLPLANSTTREVVQIMRRARGIVPEPVMLPEPLPVETFAAGGDLKNVFAIGKGRAAYLSGHFGDLIDADAASASRRAVRHMETLLDIHPEKAVCDRHPGYISAKDAEETFGESLTRVQHHYAHIASVIAEHALEGPVIGVAFDGTGFGDDNTIWGSEFFLCDPKHDLKITYQAEKKKAPEHAIPMNDVFEAEKEREEPEQIERTGRYLRMGHLRPVKMLGGDRSAVNAAQTFNCYMKDAEDRQLIWEHYSEDEILDPDMHQLLEIALGANINTYTTSSMGRLFDAASAVLGICDRNTYEGECPQKLEIAALRGELKWRTGVYTEDNPLNGRYPVRFILEKEDDQWLADGARIVGDLRMAKDGGVPVDELALEFHDAVAEMTVTIIENIAREAEQNGIRTRQVALAGGTFFNRVLLQRIISRLTVDGYQVFLNEKVPAGDGGLSLGQLYIAAVEENENHQTGVD